MGYTTEFSGAFNLSKQPTQEQINYLTLLAGTRRMKRSVSVLQKMYGGAHGLNGNYGIEGEFFAKDDGVNGQTRDESIIDYNKPPTGQPGLWCQWVIGDNNDTLEWDGGEKFSGYLEWLKYLITRFFSVWGIALNGTVKYQGEDLDDRGMITVKNNVITVTYLE